MMQSYLAIGIKNSMDIEYLKEKFNKSLELTSPINPSNMTINLWQSSNHKLVLFQWTNESHSNLWNEANKVVTLSGYTNNEGYDLAKKLYSEEYYSHENIINNLSGQFSILFMDGKENIIQGFNSITRTEPIYYADNEDYVVIGNKAIMVHLMVSSGMLPEYDFSTFGSFLNTGYFNDENTPYKYVNLLRPGSSVIFKNNNINVKDYINVNSKLDESELNSAYYDDLASIFIDSFKPLNHHNVTINSGLTGGKDSRLIAAALTFLGKDFKTHTTGFEEHPDVVLAKRIADTLGIEHEVNLPI